MRNVLGRLFAGWVGIWMILLAFLACFLVLPLATVPHGKREQLVGRVGAGYCWVLTRLLLWVKPEIKGKEHLPLDGGYLIICNHRSWLDVALVVMTTGALGIAKKELVYIPFFGIAAWAGGVLFFDRKNKASRAQILVDAVARLKAGASYHVFPEGTRTRTGKLAEKVHLKLVERCWEEKIPVLPACAWNTEQTLPAERIWAWPGHSAGLELQKLMQPADWSSAKDFSEAAWEKVVKMAQAHGADQAIVK